MKCVPRLDDDLICSRVGKCANEYATGNNKTRLSPTPDNQELEGVLRPSRTQKMTVSASCEAASGSAASVTYKTAL